MPLQEQYNQILYQIGSRPVTLVAVSKYASLAQMQEAYHAGIRHFGENKIQDALKKIEVWPQDQPVQWHFIGHLQSNKVKKTVGHFTLIHSVDSVRLAEKLSEENQAAGRVQDILLQINLSQDPSRFGFSPDETAKALNIIQLLPGVQVKGLMTMAPFTDDESLIKTVFCKLRDMKKELESTCSTPLPEISMGMSHDYVHALECGATIIRIGSFLFS